MDSNILMSANLQAKKDRPFFSAGKICDVFRSGNLMELGFLSGRCRKDRSGACIMCDYGVAKGTYAVTEYLLEMNRVLEEAGHDVDILLLCTNGSFLDESQVSGELFQAVLERAAQTRARLIEIEAHYCDVTAEKLRRIKELLPGKRIAIEMGLETVNPLYQSHIIMKGIHLPDYEKTLSLIQSFGMTAEVNIMVGLPFLSAREQMEDALATIQWAFRRSCRAVLFPMNIKPYTLLMDMYRSEHYRPVSQWMLPLLLDTLSDGELERVTVAWYGNREEIYPFSGERAVFPRACPACTAAVERFYPRFLVAQGGAERKALLAELLAQDCGCLEDARRARSADAPGSFLSRYEAYVSYLKTQGFGGHEL